MIKLIYHEFSEVYKYHGTLLLASFSIYCYAIFVFSDENRDCFLLYFLHQCTALSTAF